MTNNFQMDKVTNTLLSSYQDFSQINNDGLNIILQSATIWSKGCEDIMSCWTNMIKTSFENSVSSSKSVLTAKSPQDALQAQQNALRSQAEFLSSELQKISQLSSTVAQSAITPITDHVNTAITKATKLSQAA